MQGDAARRRSERQALAAPGDPATWVRLSREHQRAGRRSDAIQAALSGFRLHPEEPLLLERLEELGCAEGPWPSPNADPAGSQRCSFPGPSEGVQRWRLQLPRQPRGRPLVDALGRIVLRIEPLGLVRVSADARQAEVLDWEWPADVPPIIHAREPVAFDPQLAGLGGVGEGSTAALWPAVVDLTGRVYGLGPERVYAVEDGQLLWTRHLPRPRGLAAPPTGPLALVLADPVIGRESAFDHPGRVLVVDRDTGATVRTLSEGRSLCGDGQLSVAIAPDGSLVSQLGMDVFCEAPDGTLRWQRKLEWAAPPALGDGVVLVVSTIEGLLALDLLTGEQRWRRPELRTSRAPAVDAEGRVYVLGQGWFSGTAPDGERLFHLQLPSRGALGHVAIGYEGTAFFTIGDELVAVR